MEKQSIRNRNGQKIAVIIEQSATQKGLAFVMHGLGGNKEQPCIRTFARAFTDNGYTVITFDTTHTVGESDGDYADATPTNYYQDLEDVIAWTATQPFYRQPFYLTGHSLGGFAVTLFAESHPQKVKGLAPIATVISGDLKTKTTLYSPKVIEEWKRTGWSTRESTSKPGVIDRMKWTMMEDMLRYDLLPEAGKLTMPALFMVGTHDPGNPVEHQKMLYDAIPHSNKELHVIDDAPHTFTDPNHLQQAYDIFNNWIQKTL